jgi:NAD(P)H-dependent flavin oxidoreductase YrpB (nitropropane dioxygenase family)
MTYQEVLDNARKNMLPRCKVCPECNGIACKGQVPGVGGVGSGRAFTICREYLEKIKVRMDVIHEPYENDTSIELFGRKFDVPFFAAPIGGMTLNFTGSLTDEEYSRAVVDGTREAGGFAFTGDGPVDEYFLSSLPVIRDAGGVGVATLKPWKQEKVFDHIRRLEEVDAMAFAMDVDSASLINLKLLGKPVYPKPEREIREIVESTAMPFIVKGIMTGDSAKRCADAGVYGIVVSSHGGRVMEDMPAPASMLEEIRATVGGDVRIFVDGGIRSGTDVFKCLALGADAVLIGRPYAIVAHGGGSEGVRLYTEKIKDELKTVMMMTGCETLKDITRDKIMFV